MTDSLYSISFILLIWSDHFPGYTEPIQGGQPDKNNEVNWQVSLIKKRKSGDWHHACSGSIISNKHIVTAAHCFIHLDNDKIEVWNRTSREETRIVIGTNNLYSPTGIEMKIDEVIVPKAFTRLENKMLLADIAVIRLRGRIDLSINQEKYRRINLFYPKDEAERKKYDSQEGFIAGFGTSKVTLGSDGKTTHSSDGLRNVLPVHMTDYKCPKVRGLRCIQYVKSEKEPKGACSGDSGGPLYYKNFDKNREKFVLVGIISEGSHNCDIRKSHGKVEKITFIPDYKDFLYKAKNLKAKTTSPKMSVNDFEKSRVDYIVLPDQAALARKYYSKKIEKKRG